MPDLPECDQFDCTAPADRFMNTARGWLPTCEQHCATYTTMGDPHEVLIRVEPDVIEPEWIYARRMVGRQSVRQKRLRTGGPWIDDPDGGALMTTVYEITVTVTTDKPMDTGELQHLAFVAADGVVNAVLDDQRITLVEPVAFNYGPVPDEDPAKLMPFMHEERYDPRYGQRGPE